MQALVNAGGKGTRMTIEGVEKPLLEVGGKPVIQHVLDALEASASVDEILVSVSPHTRDTAEYLQAAGVRTVETSGEDFMRDIHCSLRVMDGSFIMMLPSDLPLLRSEMVDELTRAHQERNAESTLALVAEDVVRGMGVEPSYTVDAEGARWVLSGLSIIDRQKVLDDVFLEESYLLTRHRELALNVNTPDELELARSLLRD